MNKLYREDGWKAEVEVVKDESTDDWHRFTLKVMRSLEKSLLFRTPPDGTVFSVDQKKNVAFGGMWTLTDA